MPSIQTREHLLNALAEAAELEHNLLCLYLYASFSLKETQAEHLNQRELEAVKKWKDVIKEIAIQEMGHLAIVSNLITSIGGVAHFSRPNFPVTPGYYPNEFIIQLSPFNLQTLEHFIFLERPVDSKVDSDPLEHTQVIAPKRETPKNRLMAYVGNYQTVGEIYDSISEGIKYLSAELGEEKLFCGSINGQLTKAETRMNDLNVINNEKSALEGIKVIVEQGEGGDCDDCHYYKFRDIKKEYEELLLKNPAFIPYRNVTSNPVMRRNSQNENTTWIHHPKSLQYLDCANALYNLMLRFLVQIYNMENRNVEDKKLMIECTFVIMKCMGQVASSLTLIPISKENTEEMSGMTFTVDRYLNAVEIRNEKLLLSERLLEIITKMNEIEIDTQLLMKIYQKIK